ncbi:ATP-binding protein [Pasteurella multocida]|uniref:ATP-binding protein n=3 Tax=Pasteurella multocida TaxID=747 RepID=UPI002021D5BA|nr:ATP-binding protein [Pasteurella multocida]MCL7799482.1 ATP-binding protein [Pasteurella multocida]MCL7806416.1 ATP-binding protein [Pasteurella multocida]MCL7807814.1 ATP-binding protein [Pasteurella multocida]
MKSINLLYLIDAETTKNQDSFNKILQIYRIKFRKDEITGIKNLVLELDKKHIPSSKYDSFYIGYKIPQIGKEFDLLKFGKNYNINIELKSELDVEKIKKQLLRNRFYLNSIENNFFYFTFVYECEKYTFYELIGDDLKQVTLDRISEVISSQEENDVQNIDKYFSPSRYLVSPFNSVDKFLNSEYFLTQNQEGIKKEISNIINLHNKEPIFISLTGSAGTGKTLLTYDIAYEIFKNGKKTLIIHCGKLNKGHETLKSKGWKIIEIKSVNQNINIIDKCDILFIDEAQRLYDSQFNKINSKIKEINGVVIFSFDQKQTLSKPETTFNMGSKIINISSNNSFSLSEKIRTNKEISDFIKILFDKKRNNIQIPYSGNIEILFFKKTESVLSYISAIDKSVWKVIQFTPSQYNKEYHEKYFLYGNETSHSVIGQEFDNVVIIIDGLFSYNSYGELIYNGRIYYDAVKMLFQNITRVRQKLKLIIIDNSELFDRCLSVFKTQE